MDGTVAAPAHADAPFTSPRDEPGPHRPWWRRRGRLAQWALLVAAVAAIPLYRDRLPAPGEIWAAAAHAHAGWLAVIVPAVAGSMGAFTRLQRRLLRVGGLRMPLRRALAITYAGNALSTTLPAGPAVSVVYTFRQFRRGGASAQLATAVILAGGVITTAAYSLIGLLALLSDPRARAFTLAALVIPPVLALPFLPLLRRPAPRALVTAPLRRLYRAALAHPRIAPHAERLAGVPRVLHPSRRDWAALVTLAMLNWVCDILALLSAAHAVGISVSPNGIAIAYFAAQAAGSVLPLLPGGLGAIEGSMAASLVAFGAALSPAAAAVALYRLVSYWGVIAVGWLAVLALSPVASGDGSPSFHGRRAIAASLRLARGLAARSGARKLAPAFGRDRNGSGRRVAGVPADVGASAGCGGCGRWGGAG